MWKSERFKNILELINTKNMISVEELANGLNVSKVTIRRDLEELDNLGKLIKVHGGAVSAKNEFINGYPTYAVRKDFHLKEKMRIAEAASKYINPGETIFLDSSTTVMGITQFLSGISKIKVITNDLLIANKLSENNDIDLLVIGGERRKNFFTLMGYFSEKMLKEVHADKAFLGADSVDINVGFMNAYSGHVHLQKITIQTAKEIFMLCDHSKFYAISLFKICSLEKVNRLITGKELDPKIIKKFQAKKINIELV